MVWDSSESTRLLEVDELVMWEASLVMFVDEEELDGSEERSMWDEELMNEDPVPSMHEPLLLLLLLLSFFWELRSDVEWDFCEDFDCWELRLREDWLDEMDMASEMIEAVSGECCCLLVFLSTFCEIKFS